MHHAAGILGEASWGRHHWTDIEAQRRHRHYHHHRHHQDHHQHLGQTSGGIWEASGGIWKHLEASRSIWRHLKPSRGIWRHLELSAKINIFINKYEKKHLVFEGTIDFVLIFTMNLSGHSTARRSAGTNGPLPRPPEPLQINLFGEKYHF